MKRLLSSLLVLMIGILPLSGLLSGCSSEQKPISRTGFMLDTICTITLYDSGDTTILDDAFDLIRHYENLFSKTVEGSDIDKINSYSSQSEGNVAVSEETADLIKTAQHYTELTGGKFDITVGALTSLWNFTSDSPVVPQKEEIEKALLTVGSGNVSADGSAVTVRKGTQLDLGAIAKGYIADRCTDYLKEKGIARAIINLGGNIVVIGSKSSSELWNVGIQKPFAGSSEIIASVRVKDCSVVTSGIYERYFEQNGVLYHHILDPATGYPAKTDIESVTIIAKASTDADALSTSALLLGSEKAVALIESIPGIEAVIVKTDGSVVTTSGMGTKIPYTIN